MRLTNNISKINAVCLPVFQLKQKLKEKLHFLKIIKDINKIIRDKEIF